MPEITFPATVTQRAFIESDATMTFCLGPRGEGKTCSGFFATIAHALKQPPAQWPIRWAVMRDTWENLRITTIESIRRACREYGIPNEGLDRIEPKVVKIGMRTTLGFFKPIVELNFFGLDTPDDANRLQGFEGAGAWIEEPAPAADISSGIPEDALLAVTSLRQGGAAGVKPRVQITMNPPDKDHWTIKYRDDLDTIERLRSHGYTVKFFEIPKGENPGVTTEYREHNKAILEAMGRFDLIARLVEGKVGYIQAGVAVTPEFGEVHIAKTELPILRSVPVQRAWDFGGNPTCVPAGTRIMLDDGRMVPIESIEPGQRVFAVHGEVPALLAPAIVKEQRMTGIKRCLTLGTRHHEVRLTEDHPVLVLSARVGPGFGGRDGRELAWLPAGSLQRGDEVVVCRTTTPTFNESFTLPETGYDVTPDLAELIGVYLGDGTLTRKSASGAPRGIALSAYDDRLVARWSELGGRVLGRPARVFGGTVVLGACALARDFEQVGLSGKSPVRRVPAWVFRLSVEHRLRLLRGYVDSDGYVTPSGDLRFLAVNESLIWDMWALCRSVGIQVQPVRRKSMTTRFTASGRRECWGFLSRDSIWLHIGSTKWDKRIAARVRPERTRHLAPGLDIERIVKLVPGVIDEPVYDMEVDGAHSFVAQGVVLHNCVWWQIAPIGRINIFMSIRGANLGMQQHIEQNVLPWQGRKGIMDYTFEDIGDPNGLTPEARNNEVSAVTAIEEMLTSRPGKPASFQGGPIPIPDRVGPIRFKLERTLKGGQPVVQVDPEAADMIRCLSGGWHYKKTPSGQIGQIVKDAMSEHGDALGYGMGVHFPIPTLVERPKGPRRYDRTHSLPDAAHAGRAWMVG